LLFISFLRDVLIGGYHHILRSPLKLLLSNYSNASGHGLVPLLCLRSPSVRHSVIAIKRRLAFISFLRDVLIGVYHHILWGPLRLLLSNDNNAPGHGLVPSYVCSPNQSEISQKLVVTGRDSFHHVDSWPPEDCVVRKLHVDHIEPRDHVIRISAD